MYGFFSIPKSSSLNQKIHYKRHMCALCDSLHDNFGVRGRFFTNYDLTTIAIIFASLNSDEPEIHNPSKIICSRIISHKKPPEIYSVFSAISIMLAYCRILDEKNNSTYNLYSRQFITSPAVLLQVHDTTVSVHQAFHQP